MEFELKVPDTQPKCQSTVLGCSNGAKTIRKPQNRSEVQNHGNIFYNRYTIPLFSYHTDGAQQNISNIR